MRAARNPARRSLWKPGHTASLLDTPERCGIHQYSFARWANATADARQEPSRHRHIWTDR
jgi:hypothetical protein